MRLTYVEHACVLLEGSRRVLIDPYVLNAALPEDPDLVVVTHGHFDHLGEALRLARPTVSTNEIAKELARRGVPAEGINAGGRDRGRRRPRDDDRRRPFARPRDRRRAASRRGRGRHGRGDGRRDRLSRGRYGSLLGHEDDRRTLLPGRRAPADRRPLHDGPCRGDVRRPLGRGTARGSRSTTTPGRRSNRTPNRSGRRSSGRRTSASRCWLQGNRSRSRPGDSGPGPRRTFAQQRPGKEDGRPPLRWP